MQLKNILDICADNEIEKFEYTLLKGSVDTDVTGIASDSRKVTDGGIFVCIVGAVSDGQRRYCRCWSRSDRSQIAFRRGQKVRYA